MKLNINKTINRHWRDWAALVYLFICLCDFFVGPLWWNLLMFDACDEVLAAGNNCQTSRWEPLRLQMGGMFHMSFAAILGVTAWRKKDEVDTHNNKSNSTS